MNIESDDLYAYSTHQPLIQAVLNLYKPQFVLELGAGLHSTPLFKGTNYLGIENDRQWIDVIKKEFGVDITFHDLGDIGISTYLHQMTEAQKEFIRNYYLSLDLPDIKPNLLFIDSYPSCRAIAMNTLRDKFDLMIFHDAEPGTFQVDGYDTVNMEGFNTYYLKTSANWTGLMVKEDKGFELLKAVISPIIAQYLTKHQRITKMWLDNVW